MRYEQFIEILPSDQEVVNARLAILNEQGYLCGIMPMGGTILLTATKMNHVPNP